MIDNLRARSNPVLLLAIIFIEAFLLAASSKPAKAASAAYSDWCQCAIFVVNHLGLDIIPGDYYLAGTFGDPDESGKTWMDYQGFSRLSDSELPARGDVIVIRPNGKVHIPESEGSQRLVDVEAGWAGHIGVIESAEDYEIDGRLYRQLVFLSSNWGVNSGKMFVRSGCFNVDRSTVWVETNDPEISFWRETDPAMQRRHILNISRQLANGFYHIGIDGNLDGYPISGMGMTAYVWNDDLNNSQNIEGFLSTNANEISPASIQEGDAIILPEEDCWGIFAGFDENPPGFLSSEWINRHGLVYWFNPSGPTLQGPALFSTVPGSCSNREIMIYRSNKIKPELNLVDFNIWEEGDQTFTAVAMHNDGGQTAVVDRLGIQISTLQGKQVITSSEASVGVIEIPAGQEYVFSSHIKVQENGVFLVRPFLTIGGKIKTFPELEKVEYFTKNFSK